MKALELISSSAAARSIAERSSGGQRKTRVLKNAKVVGVATPYQELRNPAHVLGASVNVLGEAFMLTEMKEFTEWVINESPYLPEFIAAVKKSPTVFTELFIQYLTKAASADWNVSNSLAHAAPAMDVSLAAATTNEQAFKFLTAIVRGAEWNGFGPLELANNAFNSLPHLKAKAFNFAAGNADPAAAILKAQNVRINFISFLEKYFA
jgi:hypothetical protein